MILAPDSTPITIRAAVPDEAGMILRLTTDAFATHRDRLDPPSGVFRETTADIEEAMKEGTIYLAMAGPAALGAVRVRPATYVDALYLGRLAVVPRAQGRGIGRALVARGEEHARQDGYKTVVVGVRLELPENLAFFGRLGYSVVGEETHPGYTRPTFARLRKGLSCDAH